MENKITLSKRACWEMSTPDLVELVRNMLNDLGGGRHLTGNKHSTERSSRLSITLPRATRVLNMNPAAHEWKQVDSERRR